MRIENLTVRQVKMLKTMWDIDDPTDLAIWQSTLDESDYRMSVALQELLVASYFDESVSDDDLTEANTAIRKIQALRN